FDFDFQASVKRNGNPVESYVVIGPNFGDQSVREVNIYRHAPQLTYEFGGSVHRDNADTLKNTPVCPHFNYRGSGSKEGYLHNAADFHLVYEIGSRRFGPLLDGQQSGRRLATIRHQSSQSGPYRPEVWVSVLAKNLRKNVKSRAGFGNS